ncbi:hypothetical protein D3C80_1976180 [compost metagenome]
MFTAKQPQCQAERVIAQLDPAPGACRHEQLIALLAQQRIDELAQTHTHLSPTTDDGDHFISVMHVLIAQIERVRLSAIAVEYSERHAGVGCHELVQMLAAGA